jgi:hypothetical protein
MYVYKVWLAYDVYEIYGNWFSRIVLWFWRFSIFDFGIGPYGPNLPP